MRLVNLETLLTMHHYNSYSSSLHQVKIEGQMKLFAFENVFIFNFKSLSATNTMPLRDASSAWVTGKFCWLTVTTVDND